MTDEIDGNALYEVLVDRDPYELIRIALQELQDGAGFLLEPENAFVDQIQVLVDTMQPVSRQQMAALGVLRKRLLHRQHLASGG